MRWLFVLILAPTIAHAAAARTAPRSVVRFEGDDIDGQFQRPDGDLITGHAPESFGPLSKPPRSFTREAQRSRAWAADRLRGPGRGP